MTNPKTKTGRVRVRFMRARPEMVGVTSKTVVVVSGDPVRKGDRERLYFATRCTKCGKLEDKSHDTLKKGLAGCLKCGRRGHTKRPVLDVPRWLMMRCQQAKARCTNLSDKNYHNYGGRGIRFRFKSASAMGRWVLDNLGEDRSKQVDRKENNGHYEPGNLRLSTCGENSANKRGKRGTALMHAFRVKYPDVRYSDSTVIQLLTTHKIPMEEVAKRYETSKMPKGYGRITHPNPHIASLATAEVTL